MRVPEMPLEPRGGRLIIGATDEAPEDEDRVHELVKRANESYKKRGLT